MKGQIFLRTLAAFTATFGAAAVAHGQGAPPPAAEQQKDQKPTPKPHKVWTNDDFASLPSQADTDSRAKGTLSTVGAPANQDAQPKAAQAPPPNAPAPNIIVSKSLEEADKLVQESTV